MMEKEFIPYELALELKQLGFNQPTFFAFDNCSHPMRCTDLRTDEQKFNGVNYNSSSYTSQPTYSQAFRFFREEHGLYPDIYRNGSGGKFSANIENIVTGNSLKTVTEERLDYDIYQRELVKEDDYITSAKALGIEEGIEIGMEKGREEGIEIGREEGIEIGRIDGEKKGLWKFKSKEN